MVQLSKLWSVVHFFLDEIDYATMKIACLQPVLEGKGVYLKKVNRWVEPSHGFNVVATNTKGKGSEDGRFIGTNIMNEAFLERFPITIEQEYPSVAVEKNIVTKLLDSLGCPDPDFAAKLVSWSDIIAKLFMMVAWMKLLLQDFWLIFVKRILSLVIDFKQLNCVSIGLMKKLKLHSKICILKLMQM